MFGNSAEAVILVNVLYELLAVVLTQGLHVPWDALSYLSSCDGRLVNHLVQGSATRMNTSFVGGAACGCLLPTATGCLLSFVLLII